MQLCIRAEEWLTDSDESHAVLKILNQMESDLVGSKSDSLSWQRHSSRDSVYFIYKGAAKQDSPLRPKFKTSFSVSYFVFDIEKRRIKNAINNAAPACHKLTNDMGHRRTEERDVLAIYRNEHSLVVLVHCPLLCKWRPKILLALLGFLFGCSALRLEYLSNREPWTKEKNRNLLGRESGVETLCVLISPLHSYSPMLACLAIFSVLSIGKSRLR